jgi:hypothetical protein
MDSTIASKYCHDRCELCGAESPALACPHCGLVHYCSKDHQDQSRATHGEFCVALDINGSDERSVKRMLTFLARDEDFDLFDYAKVRAEKGIPQLGVLWQSWHPSYISFVATRASLQAQMISRQALEGSLSSFLSLKRSKRLPINTRILGRVNTRILSRFIPGLQLRLGKLDDLMVIILEEIERDTKRMPESFDILNTAVYHRDIGFQFIVMVLKIIALHNLIDVSNAAATSCRFPQEIVRLIQDEAAIPLLWSVKDLRIGAESILTGIRFELVMQIRTMIKNLHYTNPYFWAASLHPEVFLQTPISAYYTADSLVAARHSCDNRCLPNLKHVAQLAFLDVHHIVGCLPDDWESIKTFLTEVILESELQTLATELREDAEKAGGFITPLQRALRKNAMSMDCCP